MGSAEAVADPPLDPARQPETIGDRRTVRHGHLVTIPEPIREDYGIQTGDKGRVRRIDAPVGTVDRAVFDPDASATGHVVTVTRDGGFTIPKPVRRDLGIELHSVVHVQCIEGPPVVFWPL